MNMFCTTVLFWNQNVCKCFFETKNLKYEEKSCNCNETTTFQQKSCFKVKVARQISYFEMVMLVKSLALKPKCYTKLLPWSQIHCSKSLLFCYSNYQKWKFACACGIPMVLRVWFTFCTRHTNMVLEVGVTRLFFVRHFLFVFILICWMILIKVKILYNSISS